MRVWYWIIDVVLWFDVSFGFILEWEEEFNSSFENLFDLKGYLSWELDLFGSNWCVSEVVLVNYYS